MRTRDPSARVKLELRLFGRFVLKLHGAPEIPLPHKGEELLAFLALATPGEHSRDAIAEALWADAHGEVRKQFRQTLWKLRSALRPHLRPEEVFRLDREWVEFRRSERLDVDFWRLQGLVEHRARRGDVSPNEAAFKRAATIDDLCRRPLLEGWVKPWVLQARDWAREQHLRALEDIVHWYQMSTNYGRVLDYTDRGLLMDSSIELFHRERIRAYWELGDRVGAARAYQRCLEVLRSEYGCEPGAETRELGRRALGTPEDST
jgi:DNA-binding SARP family transcriptional activator